MNPIEIYPARVLRLKAAPVERMTSEIRHLVDHMTEVMYEAEGVGLAAPQIGDSRQVIVVDVGDGPFSLVNPEIVESDSEEVSVEEGCLSLPDIHVHVRRPAAIRIRGLDADGKTVERSLEGMSARAVQHEIDHLRGVLIIDHASAIQKTLLKNRLKRFRE
ncbi:MAG: peptide deformylase [bacterium]|nr:peptide deformylase [bacterium]